VKRENLSLPFVRKPKTLERLARIGRHFGQRPSTLLHVEADQVAMDLDYACSVALDIADNKRDFKRLESLVFSFAFLLVSAFGGDTSRLEDSAQEDEDDQENGQY
jgi:hypothetical protein